ncbi:MAG: hypothetical protein ACJAQ6_001816 [Arenicella sp.]|jgi:hypothetical protein
MKIVFAKSPLLTVRLLVASGALLLATACQAIGQDTKQAKPNREASKGPVHQTEDCPIVSSQNWSAKIASSDPGKPILSINGDIELPNPGYSVVLEQGIADRSATPSQHFDLRTERLTGFYIQAITAMTLEHSSVAIAKHYHSIVIHCGEQIIATIENVSAR